MTKPSKDTWRHIIHQRFDLQTSSAQPLLQALAQPPACALAPFKADTLSLHLLAFERLHRPFFSKARMRPVQVWGVDAALEDGTPCFAWVRAERGRGRASGLFDQHEVGALEHTFVHQDSLVRCTHTAPKSSQLVEVTAMEPCFVDPRPQALTQTVWRNLAGACFEVSHSPWAGWRVQSHRHQSLGAWAPEEVRRALNEISPTQTHLFEGSDVLLTPYSS